MVTKHFHSDSAPNPLLEIVLEKVSLKPSLYSIDLYSAAGVYKT